MDLLRHSTEDLAGLDLPYAPPFASVWDPILVAANLANRIAHSLSRDHEGAKTRTFGG